jgi:hypothetical protein
MRTRRVLINGLVMLASLVAGLGLCELASRTILNPADYLSATTVPDDILGIRIAPGAAGFDQWGFRNPRVPPTADIVAIGDSHTYGNTATMADAWPSVVARVTGRSVYNLGLGGYGPNQYYHLLTTRAPALKPRWVVCALYMGDDFENAFLMTYGKDHWAFLRRAGWGNVDPNIWGQSAGLPWHRNLRVWLSQHSVLYQTVVHGPVLGGLKGRLQIARASRGEDGGTTSLIETDGGIREAFRPLGIRARLDQRNPAVREGMRITFELLTRMDRACREQGCRLVVALIPTKEMVFAPHLLRVPGLHLREVISDLVASEIEATAKIRMFLDAADISHVDTLPALRRHLGERLYARSDRDMHPSRNGYRVIGEAVAHHLQSRAPAVTMPSASMAGARAD